MFNNYHYFLVLCEELNISKAAKRLFISHQCLSSYIRNLENHYGIRFFVRSPKFALTPAGKSMLNSLRQIERVELNLTNCLSNIKNEQSGTINYGITEGRYRIFIPKLLKEYRTLYPNVQVRVFDGTSENLEKKLYNNELDMFAGGLNDIDSPNLKSELLINEHIYLVISDNLLQQYFPESFPQCKIQFANGVDLRLFQEVPFVLNKKNFHSRKMIDKHLDKIDTTLNVITECTQPDIHHLLCDVDYAASFCFSMYIPSIRQINLVSPHASKLNIFPIAGLDDTNPVTLSYLKNAIFTKYGLDLINLTKELCRTF
jgi:DNA-binding transcriptional LysR family regulator